MTKRILALLLALCLIISAAPVSAGAATGQQVSAGSVTVTAGNTATVTLKAENFESIATMDIDVYYDAQVLTLSSTSNGSFLSGAQASVNTAEAGLIKLSAMSLNGLSGSGTLLTMKFSTAANCTPGTYPVSVAVGRAHHTDLSAATVGSVSGSVTVNERPVTQETFSINHSFSKRTLKQGETLTYRVSNYNSSRAFVSGDFTVTYDHTLFRFVSLELSSALTGEGAVYSTNTDILGQVRVVYANQNPVNVSTLFTVNLEVIADTNLSTTIKTQAANVYKADLSAYLPGSCSGTVTLQKKPEVVDYPNAFLQTEELVVDRENKSTFYLEAGAGVAAADFVITYDPTVLSCVGVAAAQEASEHGGMVIINDNFTEGTIRFSYVNMSAYADTDLPLVNITWKPLQSPAEHYQVTLGGVGVVDTQQNALQLEYVTSSGCILVREVIPPACLTDGRTHYGCACGKGYDVDIVPMLGHDIQKIEAREPTCTEVGWNAHEACTRGDYFTGVEIPALGHDYIDHMAKSVTCTEAGWEAYQTCGRCDFSSYEEIPALGHRVVVQAEKLVDPLVIDNTDFELVDGIYYSTNHEDNSSTQFTITTVHDCTLTLHCGASSEQNYDKITVLLDDSWMGEVSGLVTDQTMTFYLFAGDVVTVRYSKDGSVSNNEDRGWVSLEYDYVWATGSEDAPAENFNPDCTVPVTCHYCGVEVKAALGHDTVAHEGKAATCSEGGWKPYETCKRCDYTSYTEIPALGHDAVYHEGQAPTCLEVGWDAYETCSRCDYSTYTQLPPLGHRVVTQSEVLVDPLVIENMETDPFELVDGTYYSTNHSDGMSSQFTVTATHDCTLTLYCGVSSEANWDKLFVYINDYQQFDISGDYVHHTVTYQLYAGDVVTIRYSKDGSVSAGEDRGWVRLEYEYVWDIGSADAPAENFDPDCTHAVNCDYCGAEVKAALGHDTITHEGLAPDCLNGGWAPYETCSRCDYSSYQDLEALGHELTYHDAKAATCLEIGWNAYETCSRCDHTTYVEIPALGHDTVSHDAKAATCLENGWDAYETCSRCDYTTYVEISALGHDLIYHEGKEPTYKENGWEAYETCSRCDHTTYVELPQLWNLGDIDQSGSVNNDDVALLLWHTLFPTDYPIEAEGDLNRDGSINNDDVVLLLWHTLFPEDYPIV